MHEVREMPSSQDNLDNLGVYTHLQPGEVDGRSMEQTYLVQVWKTVRDS